MCRVANAELCWHATKRRQFLGAYQGDGSLSSKLLFPEEASTQKNQPSHQERGPIVHTVSTVEGLEFLQARQESPMSVFMLIGVRRWSGCHRGEK